MNSSKNPMIDMGQLLAPTTQQKTVNLTYFDLLSLILVILKGMGYISCSWIIPFVPICIPIVAYFFVVFVGFCTNIIVKK